MIKEDFSHLGFRERMKKIGDDTNCVQVLTSEKNFKGKIVIVFNSMGMSLDNIVYYTITNLFKLTSLVEKESCLISIGENETGKSAMFDLIFGDITTIFSGLPTEADLRGDATKKNDRALFSVMILVLEELNSSNNLQMMRILSIVKDAIMRRWYLEAKEEKKPVNCSIIINANNYFPVTNLDSLQGKEILSSLPTPFQYDKALIDRFPFVLPHYKSIFGEIVYIKEAEVIPITNLENFIKAQREKRTFLVKAEGITSSRLLKSTSLVISGVTKLLFPEIEREEEIPKYLINGIAEFAKHFNSIATQETKVYNPFNANSLEFILEILGYDIKSIKFALFHKERLIIVFRKKQAIYKIALTGFGIEQNRKEVEFTHNSSEPLLANIEKVSPDFKIIQYKAHDFYTSKIINTSTKGLDFKSIKEHNEDLIKIIQVSVDLEKDANLSDEKFEGIPPFQLKLLQKEVQRIFGFKNEILSKISRKNFAIDKNGEIKLFNFSEFIEI